jgi:hypothetical protein
MGEVKEFPQRDRNESSIMDSTGAAVEPISLLEKRVDRILFPYFHEKLPRFTAKHNDYYMLKFRYQDRFNRRVRPPITHQEFLDSAERFFMGKLGFSQLKYYLASPEDPDEKIILLIPKDAYDLWKQENLRLPQAAPIPQPPPLASVHHITRDRSQPLTSGLPEYAKKFIAALSDTQSWHCIHPNDPLRERYELLIDMADLFPEDRLTSQHSNAWIRLLRMANKEICKTLGIDPLIINMHFYDTSPKKQEELGEQRRPQLVLEIKMKKIDFDALKKCLENQSRGRSR